VIGVKTCVVSTWTRSVSVRVAGRRARDEVRTVVHIVPRLHESDDIGLTVSDPLCNTDVLVVYGTRVENTDRNWIEVAVPTPVSMVFDFMAAR